MSKPLHTDARDYAEKVSSDINALSGRLTTVINQNISGAAASAVKKSNILTPSTIMDKKIIEFEAVGSIMSMGGARLLHACLPPQDIDKLVDSFFSYANKCDQFIADPNKKKYTLISARIEAGLKGFVYPESKINDFKITKEEHEIIKNTLNQALLEMPKGISKDEYSQKLINRTNEILKTKNFTPDQLYTFNKFITEGKLDKEKTVDSSKLSPAKISELSTTASKVADSFTNFNEKNTKESKLILNRQNVIDRSIEKVTHKKKASINYDTQQKIRDKLTPALMKLDPIYLEQNHNIITEEIATALNKKKTFLSHFRKEFKISSKNLDKITEKIVEKHLNKSKELLSNIKLDLPEAHIKNLIEHHKIEKTELVNKINEFLKQNNKAQAKLNPNDFDNPAKNYKILAEIRKINPKNFDEIMARKEPNIKKSISASQQLKKQSHVEKLKESRGKKQQVKNQLGK